MEIQGEEQEGQQGSTIQHIAKETLTELRQLFVTAEHSMEAICSHLGIHDFSHHLATSNLTGTTLTLYSDGHLEIRREGMPHATTFPVQLID